ncbi:unnamed protein product [Schistocephalus solidus]|uniref:Uncharacterized protein n=1 Tax=Schistocephalus solidus TaxID=70667 RepID=A0A183T2K6_SCHSO|nr:unnamed protein product [Schistocephalus solidus]
MHLNSKGFLPVPLQPQINSSKIKLFKVSTSVCPPGVVNGYGYEHGQQLRGFQGLKVSRSSKFQGLSARPERQFLRQQAQIRTQLKEEMRQHDEPIVDDFKDTYFNLSLKMQHTFIWAA